MKKILTVLLTTAMMLAINVGVFADELELSNNPTSGSIKLSATKASSYTIKIPKTVDVSNNSTTITILAKGDVDGAKQISVSENTQEKHYLVEAAKNTQVELSVTSGAAIKGSDIKADYDQTKATTLTVTHSALAAGNWSCDLPIIIKLENLAS